MCPQAGRGDAAAERKRLARANSGGHSPVRAAAPADPSVRDAAERMERANSGGQSSVRARAGSSVRDAGSSGGSSSSVSSRAHTLAEESMRLRSETSLLLAQVLLQKKKGWKNKTTLKKHNTAALRP
jgi:hypothetical protein